MRSWEIPRSWNHARYRQDSDARRGVCSTGVMLTVVRDRYLVVLMTRRVGLFLTSQTLIAYQAVNRW